MANPFLDLVDIKKENSFLGLKEEENSFLNLNVSPGNANPFLDFKQQNNPVQEQGVEENSFEKKNLAFKALDLLSRPGYAVKSGVKEQILQESGEHPDDLIERYKAMWKGLHGHERVTANELFKLKGVEGVPFLGFTAEVLGDPVTYTPASFFKA